MPSFTLDVPQSGNRPTPVVETEWISLQSIQQAGGLYTVPLAECLHANIDNHLPRQILVQFDTAAQQRSLGYIVDPGSERTVSPSFPLYACTIIDLFQYGNLPFPLLTGMEEGARAEDRLPFKGVPTGFSGTIPNYGGGVLITASSMPIDINRAYRPTRAKVNWVQSSVAAGAGTINLNAATSAIQTNMRSSGYFDLVQFINTTATAFSAVIIPAGGNSLGGNGTNINVPANTSFQLPIEAEYIIITYTAAAQAVIACQSVVMAANTAEP